MLKTVRGILLSIYIDYIVMFIKNIEINNLCLLLFSRKPQYSLANDLPLNLFDCQFENVSWIVESESLSEVISSLQYSWATHMIK